MIKRLTLGVAAAAAASVLVLAAPASADHSATFTGSILAGNPLTSFTGGVTENLEVCSPGGDLEGVDGVWFDIATFEGGVARLTVDPTLDGDVWFYDANCAFINYDHLAQAFIGGMELGAIPANARWAIVDGFAGTGNFSLRVDGPVVA